MAEDTTPQKPGASKGMLMMLLLTQLIVLGAVGYLFTQVGKPVPAEEIAEEEAAEEEVLPPPQFHALEPAFVVNLNANRRSAFLQVAVEIMSRDPEVIAAIESNEPVLRNNLLMLFSDLDAQVILTREGKQALREQALAEIIAILEAANAPASVEDVYFTSFVVQ